VYRTAARLIGVWMPGRRSRNAVESLDAGD
jgi:hypothetical protein